MAEEREERAANMVCASVCVRGMVVFAVFQENVAVDLQLSQSERAKNRAASKRPSQICTVLQVLMTKKYRDRLRRIFSPLFRFWGVPFNKRVLAEEEQTVATLLEKSANLEEPEQREVDFSLS